MEIVNNGGNVCKRIWNVRSPSSSIPFQFLLILSKIKLGIEGDLTSYLYDVLPLGPPFINKK